MKLFKFIIPGFFFLLSAFFVNAQSLEKYVPAAPNPPKLVNDYLDLLTTSQEEALEKKLVAYDDSTSNQIAIVTIGDIGDNDISDFALAVLRKWGVGGKEHNNGVVVVVLVDKERKKQQVWISTGYGLEGAIPDITAKSIINHQIIPNFKDHDIYRGLDEGTDALIKAAAGEYKAPEGYDQRRKGKANGWLVGIVLLVLLIIFFSGSGNGGSGLMSRRGYRRWGSGPPIIWFPPGGGGWGGGGGGDSGGFGGFGGFGGGSGGGGGAGGSW